VHERLQGVGHLHGQLSRRHEDQRSRTPGRRGGRVSGEPGDHGQSEGERLARAGPGAPEHVAAGNCLGDRGRLDGERLGDPVARQPLDQPLRQAERREGIVGGDLDRTRAQGTTGGLGPGVGGEALGLGIDPRRRAPGDMTAGQLRLMSRAVSWTTRVLPPAGVAAFATILGPPLGPRGLAILRTPGRLGPDRTSRPIGRGRRLGAPRAAGTECALGTGERRDALRAGCLAGGRFLGGSPTGLLRRAGGGGACGHGGSALPVFLGGQRR